MAMQVTIEVTCDNCEDVVDVFEQEMYDGECIGEFHVDAEMHNTEDDLWLCKDCHDELNDEDEEDDDDDDA